MDKSPNISTRLEDENKIAKALSEMFLLIYANSCRCEYTGVTLDDIHFALWLLCKISENHVERLETLLQDVTKLCAEARNSTLTRDTP